MNWTFDDGGRADAGFNGKTGDCVCRAISIALERPYREVYDLINALAKSERTGKRKTGTSSARSGVYKGTIKKVMKHYGWVFTPTMKIGSGCTVHLRDGEVPMTGRYVISLSKHYTSLVDGEVHDIYDPSRGGDRCVYGIWHRPEEEV